MRASLLLVAACTLAAGVHAQQSYPSRPVKLIVADAPGSASDTRARQVGAFAVFVRADRARWKKAVADAGITPE